MLLGAPYLLQLFGRAYADEGAGLLRLLALGALPNLVNMLYLSVARVRNRVGVIVTVQAALCTLALALSYPLLHWYGIMGVGIAWLSSQTLVAAGITLARLRSRTQQEPNMETTMVSLAGALADVRGLFVSMLLIALLALKEFAQSASGVRAKRWARALQVAIVPLLLLFGLAITLRLTQEQSVPPAIVSAQPAQSFATAIPATALPAVVPAPIAPPVPPAAELLAYSVRKGDLLFDLAQRFDTSIETIVALNPQINPASLVIGDVLRIPVASPAGAGEITYAVRSGDTLYDLAARFQTSVEAIAALNPQITPERLMVGQALRIPIAQLQSTQERKP
jgi:LysM repeat protein